MPMAEINVTPLVDVMLVLLIIFMVTAPLLNAGVPVNLPDSSAKQLETPGEPVEVTIDREGKVFIGEKPVAGDVGQAMADIAKGGADRQIVLRADTSLDYGRVAAVMGQMSSAGLTKVSLVTSMSRSR
jgi:biopolymer transport protein TolR